jgi:hypothetical protein
MNIPDDARDRVRDLLWSRASELGWSELADTERSKYYERWTRDLRIGGVLAHYMDPRKVRVYIKDSLLKPYERARVSGTEQQVLYNLGVYAEVGVAQRYIKPHGLRFDDGRIISWGKSRDWKLILMAMHERATLSTGSSPFAVVLLESGKTSDVATRMMVRDAGQKLGITRLEWLESNG